MFNMNRVIHISDCRRSAVIDSERSPVSTRIEKERSRIGTRRHLAPAIALYLEFLNKRRIPTEKARTRMIGE
jgi:hypothetical protein